MFKDGMLFPDENLFDENLGSMIELDKQKEIKNKKPLEDKKRVWNEILDSDLFSSETKLMFDNEKADIAKEALENINNYDQATFRHIVSMLNLYITLIREKKEIEEDDEYLLFNAIATHDWGKKIIDKEILNKKEKLENEEFEQIKKHPLESALILKDKNQEQLADIVVRHHLYKYKNPYPKEMTIEEILPGHRERIKANPKLEKAAKILAIIDKTEAMLTENRPYKMDMWVDNVKDEIKKDLNDEGLDELIDFIVEKWVENEKKLYHEAA